MNYTFIIAEAGVNHNGSLDKAKQLVKIAADAGADAVKFQTFITENIVTISAEKADYQKRATDCNESQFKMIKKLELSKSDHIDLISFCNECGITFLSSPFDIDSVDLLADLGLEILKIPSGEITNLPYLEAIGRHNRKIIMSTGMADMKEIEKALNILTRAGTPLKNITVLHANTEYPTPMADVNLRAMQTIKEAFNVKVGYSDHTLGIEVPIAAVALGACVIEKHFTLDRNMHGPDHKASLVPEELKNMIIAIRNIEKALGGGTKKPSASELPNIIIARKSIVANIPIKEGDIYTTENIAIKRPGAGISPMKWYDVLGTTAKRNYNPGELIDFE